MDRGKWKGEDPEIGPKFVFVQLLFFLLCDEFTYLRMCGRRCQVLDVTKWLDKHPGGKSVLLKVVHLIFFFLYQRQTRTRT